MKDTLAALQKQDAKPDQVCFIFHRFIPATVAAWALAIPNQQIVLVDSLWGLPDGLQYLPHDTFEFDIRRNEISAEHIRFKPKFLQETESGEWKLINVSRTNARHRSLTISDLREVASQTHRIAAQLGKATQIMWFCAVPEEAGVGQNVPWFMMEPEPSVEATETPVAQDRQRISITSLSDLEEARRQPTGRFIMLLEPESNLFRSPEFLDGVAAVSKEKDFPVMITGSILSHAYYRLERMGVAVVGDASRRTRVRQRQVFRKLVRDAIPAKIEEHGERANLARIAKQEARTALVIKLFEEAQELLKANDPKEVTTELADLLEVVRALAAATGSEWDDVQKVAEEKRQARGSFAQNVVLMETSWPRWAEPTRKKDEVVIPLKELAEIKSDENGHLLNFASAIAKDANNIVALTNNLHIAVSIVDGGIRISRVPSPTRTDGFQLELPFAPQGEDLGD